MKNNFLSVKLIGNNKMFDDIESYISSNINKQHILPKIEPKFPDFFEKIDAIEDSIRLALNTLGMSRSEYNSSDVSSLKSQIRIDCLSRTNIDFEYFNLL